MAVQPLEALEEAERKLEEATAAFEEYKEQTTPKHSAKPGRELAQEHTQTGGKSTEASELLPDSMQPQTHEQRSVSTRPLPTPPEREQFCPQCLPLPDPTPMYACQRPGCKERFFSPLDR